MKNDKYSQARGGWSRVLAVSCEECDEHVCYYQKDGPGPLKRMYFDRITDHDSDEEVFKCNNCGHELGFKVIYKKEDRPAYRLFQDSVKKKIVKLGSKEIKK